MVNEKGKIHLWKGVSLDPLEKNSVRNNLLKTNTIDKEDEQILVSLSKKLKNKDDCLKRYKKVSRLTKPREISQRRLLKQLVANVGLIKLCCEDKLKSFFNHHPITTDDVPILYTEKFINSILIKKYSNLMLSNIKMKAQL